MKFYGYNTPTGAAPFPRSLYGDGPDKGPKYWVAAKDGKVFTIYIKNGRIKPLLGYTPKACENQVNRKVWAEIVPADNLKKLFDELKI